MYAIAITNPVRAVMILATSTDTFIESCAFMVFFQSGTVSQAYKTALKT
jgi:hypothetical protein